MSRVTLVVWRDAHEDPPKRTGAHLTNKGLQLYDPYIGWHFGHTEQPSWWCDPQPPGEDALTVDDARYVLRRAAREAEDDALLLRVSDVNGDGEAFYARRATHLRAALEALK